MKPEVSILFAPEARNHQKRAKNTVFRSSLTLRGHYRPQKRGKSMKISGKTFHDLKKHQKNFEHKCFKNRSLRSFQSENLSNFTKNAISPQPYDGFQRPLEGRQSSVITTICEIFILLRQVELKLPGKNRLILAIFNSLGRSCRQAGEGFHMNSSWMWVSRS